MKTEQEIREMIQKLNKEKDNLPQHSAFGDDNWAIIDGQRDVLEWVLGEMEEEDIV